MCNRSPYYIISMIVLTSCQSNAMTPFLTTVAGCAVAANTTMQACKPIVKEAEHIFGHHKRHAPAPAPAAAPQPAESEKTFGAAFQKHLTEKGSEALADGIIETGKYVAKAAADVLTSWKQPQPRPLAQEVQPAPAFQTLVPQIIILHIKRKAAHRQHRHYYYSSSEESNSSSSESGSSNSTSSSNSSESSESSGAARHNHPHRHVQHHTRHHRH
jgi:hypothetical protein